MKKITISLLDGKKTIYHNRVDDTEIKLIADQIFDIEEYRAGYEVLKDRVNPVVLDIGAHIGLATNYFAQIKGSEIYSFEPSVKNYECLVKNTKGLNVKTFNFAVTAFNCEDRHFGRETLYCQRRGLPIEEKVATRNMEWIFETNKLEHVDLMKIDTEGSEYEILFTKSFKNVASKIDYIIGESHMGIEPFHPQDLVPVLGRLGFDVGFLPNINYIKKWKVVFMGDNEEEEVELEYKMATLFFAKRRI